MRRTLIAGATSTRDDLDTLIKRDGLDAVRKALRAYGKKSPGAPKRLNEIRDLIAGIEIEIWRHRLGKPGKPASALAACRHIKQLGGLAVPNKIPSGEIGDLCGLAMNFQPAAFTDGQWMKIETIDALRKYHERGQRAFRKLPENGKRWWREWAEFGPPVAK